MSTTAKIAGILALAAASFAGGYLAKPDPPPRGEPSRSVAAYAGVVLDGDAGKLREILLKPNVVERTGEVAQLLRHLGPDSVPEVLRAYESVLLDIGDPELMLLGAWWAEIDPEAAYEWTNGTYAAEHPAVAIAMFRSWGRSDPQQALEWLRAGEFGRSFNMYHEAVVTGWHESGKPGLMEYLSGLSLSETRERSLMAIARRRVLRDGLDATFEWAEDVEDSSLQLKINLFRRVGAAAAEVDPERAAEWGAEHADGDYGYGLPQFIAVRWAEKDGAAAMTWLSTLSPGANRDTAVRETWRAWIDRDGTSAVQWLRQQDPSERWLAEAVSQYALKIHQRHEKALELASRISEPALRRSTIGRIARAWLIGDEAAARAWIEASDLSEQYKQRIYEIPGLERLERLRVLNADIGEADS